MGRSLKLSGSEVMSMYRRLLSMVIVVLLMLSIVIPIAVVKAQQSSPFEVVGVFWGSPSSPASVGPGMKTQRLTVALRYTGNETLAQLKAALSLPYCFIDSISKSSIAETIYTQTVNSQSVIYLTFWIDVDESAASGEYAAYLDLYKYEGDRWSPLGELSIVISIRDVANLVIEPSQPITVYPGYSNVTIYAKNTKGGYAYGVMIRISTPSQQISIFETKIDLGDVKPNDIVEVNIPIYIPSSTIGLLIPLNVEINYVDAGGFNKTTTSTVYLRVEQPTEPDVKIEVYPETLIAGIENTIYIKINSSASLIRNISISMDLPQQIMLVRGSSRITLDKLETGLAEFPLVVVPIGISSQRTVLQAYVSLSYRDQYDIIRSSREPIFFTVLYQPTNINIDIEPQTLAAGRANRITVTVENLGSLPIYDAVMTITFPQVVMIRDFNGKWLIGNLKPGEKKSLEINIVVPSTTSEFIQITALLTYIDSSYVSRSEGRTFTLPVKQYIGPRIDASIKPNTLVGGTYSTLHLTVVNRADRTLSDIVMTVSPSGGISLIGSSGKWNLGSLEPGEVIEINLTVYADDVQATRTAMLMLNFNLIDSVTNEVKTESFSFTILITPRLKRELEVSVLQWTQQVLRVGEINNITISIGNPNNYEVRSVILRVSIPAEQAAQSALLAPDIYYVDVIEPGGRTSISIPLYLAPTYSQQALTLLMSLSYFDGATTFTISKNAIFPVTLPPALNVTNYAVTPAAVSPGQTFSVSLSLVNRGRGSAYNVIIRAEPSPLYTPLLGSETYISEINKGASTTVAFSFRLSAEVNASAIPPTPTTGREPPSMNRTFEGPSRPRNATQDRAPENITAIVPRVIILITYEDNVGRQYNMTIPIPITVVSAAGAAVGGAGITAGGRQISPILAAAIAVPVIAAISVGAYLIARRVRIRKT